jgi:hypothetical protein
MNKIPSVYVITSYHFGQNDQECYERLIKSLTETLSQLCGNDYLVLVANGLNDGASSTKEVIQSLPCQYRHRIHPVEIAENCRAVGAINTGVQSVLEMTCNSEDIWVGSIQSSTIIGEGWISQMKNCAVQTCADGLYGQIYHLEDRNSLWTIGHSLDKGRTKLECRSVKCGEEGARFPCLSAAIYRRSKVGEVIQRYGTAVWEGFEHYGDCTDLALRMAECGSKFTYCQDAKAYKRKPIDRPREAATYQIVSACLYYTDKKDDMEEIIRNYKSCECDINNALEIADNMLGKEYTEYCTAPNASWLENDLKWH